MNDQETNKKGVFLKTLIVIILLGVLAFSAWGAIQIVKSFPSTVDSLANIADTVYNYDPEADKELVVKTDRNVFNTGETVTAWWNLAQSTGTYVFSYECKDGVALDIKYGEKDFTSISCNNAYDLGTVDRMEIRADSEKERFAEVNYTVSFFKKNDNAATASETNSLSIINPLVSDTSLASSDSTNTEDDVDSTPGSNKDEVTPTEVEEVIKEVETPTETAPNLPTTKPTYSEPVYIYEVPISDPNGRVDLVLSNLKLGFVNDFGIFIENNSILENVDGAIQFTVHNIGNKTSEDWIFEANLPGDIKYKSTTQTSLKPNERSVVTIQFPAIQDSNVETIIVKTRTESDVNGNNNYLEKSITVTK